MGRHNRKGPEGHGWPFGVDRAVRCGHGVKERRTKFRPNLSPSVIRQLENTG
jgi:hypothetical protein